MKRITVPVETEIADALSDLAKDNLRSSGAEASRILREFFANNKTTARKPRGGNMRKGALV